MYKAKGQGKANENCKQSDIRFSYILSHLVIHRYNKYLLCTYCRQGLFYSVSTHCEQNSKRSRKAYLKSAFFSSKHWPELCKLGISHLSIEQIFIKAQC